MTHSQPGSKKTMALRHENSWSFICMSLSGLTMRSSIMPAILLISNSLFSRDIIAPLPSMSMSVQRSERRAAPNIKFSPAWVLSSAIWVFVFVWIRRQCIFELKFRIYLLYRPWAIRKSKVLTWPTRPATAAAASSSRLFRLPWLYAAVWFRPLERQS